MPDDRRTAFEFPCTFPIKVIGLMRDDFAETVFEAVRVHVPGVRREDMTVRASNGGKYLSISLTFVAGSLDQLDELYRDVGKCPGVLMIL